MENVEITSLGHIILESYEKTSIENPQGRKYTLGPMPFWIWKNHKTKNDSDTVLRQFSQKYSLEKGAAQKEIETIIQQLEKTQLIKRQIIQ